MRKKEEIIGHLANLNMISFNETSFSMASLKLSRPALVNLLQL